ncbi:MAG TPA: OmpH family outer membrane protein [Clostridia bacterium]|nr:OmpH family outer membrane protein [Clostridia bacterium]
MTSNFSRIAIAVLGLSLASVAQTGAAPAPAAPAQGAAAPAAAPAAAAPATSKVGIVNIQGAVANSNEGRRDLEALDKKMEPRVKQLQGLQGEVENLSKQLNTQGDKLNADARAGLERQIADRTKQFQRGREDYQNEVQALEQEIFQRIAPKLLQTVDGYAKANGYTLILDWGVLQNGVIWAVQGTDITPQVIAAYNQASGVPAPAAPAGGAGAGAAPRGTPAPARPAGGTPAPKPGTPR